MIGNNELHLNEATVIAALQMYLDSLMPPGAPKVTSVKATSSGYDDVFTVKLESKETK